MNGIRNTYLYVCGSQRLLNIRRIYTSAGLIGLIAKTENVSFRSGSEGRDRIRRADLSMKKRQDYLETGCNDTYQCRSIAHTFIV